MVVSRDTFYRYQELVNDGGVDSLINRSRRIPNLKNRVDEQTEQAVIKFAVEFPAYGQARTSNELRKQGIFVSGSGYGLSGSDIIWRTLRNAWPHWNTRLIGRILS